MLGVILAKGEYRGHDTTKIKFIMTPLTRPYLIGSGTSS